MKKKTWLFGLFIVGPVALILYLNFTHFNTIEPKNCQSLSENNVLFNPYHRAKNGLLPLSKSELKKVKNSLDFELTYLSKNQEIPGLHHVTYNCSSEVEVNVFQLTDSLTLTTFYDFSHQNPTRGLLEHTSPLVAPTLLYPMDVYSILLHYALVQPTETVFYGVPIENFTHKKTSNNLAGFSD